MRAVRPLALLLLFAAALVVTDRALTPPLARLFAETRVGIVAGQANLALAHRDADLLVFGSSRAVYQVDPDVLAARLGLSAQNAGNRGQGVRYARGLEALLLERGSRAKVFVLVLDFEDLWSEDSERLQALAPFWGESPVLDALLVQRGPFERLKLASGLYRYNSMLLPMLAHRLRPDPGADAANGFLPLPPRVGPLGRAGAPGGADPGPPVPDVLDAYRGFIRDARAPRARPCCSSRRRAGAPTGCPPSRSWDVACSPAWRARRARPTWPSTRRPAGISRTRPCGGT